MVIEKREGWKTGVAVLLCVCLVLSSLAVPLQAHALVAAIPVLAGAALIATILVACGYLTIPDMGTLDLLARSYWYQLPDTVRATLTELFVDGNIIAAFQPAFYDEFMRLITQFLVYCHENAGTMTMQDIVRMTGLEGENCMQLIQQNLLAFDPALAQAFIQVVIPEYLADENGYNWNFLYMLPVRIFETSTEGVYFIAICTPQTELYVGENGLVQFTHMFKCYLQTSPVWTISLIDSHVNTDTDACIYSSFAYSYEHFLSAFEPGVRIPIYDYLELPIDFGQGMALPDSIAYGDVPLFEAEDIAIYVPQDITQLDGATQADVTSGTAYYEGNPTEERPKLPPLIPPLDSNGNLGTVPGTTSVPGAVGGGSSHTSSTGTGGIGALPGTVPGTLPGVNTGTGTGTIPGTGTETGTIPGTGTGADTGTETGGLIQTIIDWLSRIFARIGELISALVGFISDFFNMDSFTLDFTPLKLGLTEVFPFCIPFDFARLVKVFSASPSDYQLKVDFDTSYLSVHHTVDLAPFRIPILFFRWVVTVWFAYILISRTRDFMKW